MDHGLLYFGWYTQFLIYSLFFYIQCDAVRTCNKRVTLYECSIARTPESKRFNLVSFRCLFAFDSFSAIHSSEIKWAVASQWSEKKEKQYNWLKESADTTIEISSHRFYVIIVCICNFILDERKENKLLRSVGYLLAPNLLQFWMIVHSFCDTN